MRLRFLIGLVCLTIVAIVIIRSIWFGLWDRMTWRRRGRAPLQQIGH